jgi:glycosyltransferase involved in cell wall biosynthesis
MNNTFIRVLHIAPLMNNGGGIENFLMNYYRNIDKENIQFDFIVHSNKKGNLDSEIMKMGGKIFYIKNYFPNIISYIFRLGKILVKYKKFGVIHIHTTSGNKLFDGLVSRILGFQKVIFHSHSNLREKSIKFIILRILFRFIGTDFWACSESAGVFFFGKKILKSKKFKVINNAIDCDRFLYNPYSRMRLRNSHSFGDKFIIGHVGRFTSEKNHVFILNVFKKFLEYNKDSLLVFAGNGIEIDNIKLLTSKLSLDNFVYFIGNVDNIFDWYSVFDLFLFPSKHEGFGMALIEAQISGLHCISTLNVPHEVVISNSIIFKDINNESLWVDEILKVSIEKNISRNQNFDYKKFDIKSQSNLLLLYYLEGF